MSTFQPQNTSYGLSQAIINNAPTPVPSKRNPLTSDFMQIGTIWSNITTNAVYILASITNNSANWILVEAGGGAGNFANLTVNPGPTNLTGVTTVTGTANINTAGAANTFIGVAPATGQVQIGNATGNTYILAGNLNVTAGDVILQSAFSGYSFLNGVIILSGNGDPNGVAGFAAPVGSLYLNATGSTTTNRLFINTDGGTTWTYFTSNA